MYNMSMITTQNVTEDILPAFLHTTILVLRGFNREGQADFLESLVDATKFGQERYANYTLNRTLEKKLRRKMRSTRKSFKNSCKEKHVLGTQIDQIINRVNKEIADTLAQLQVSSNHLHEATIHPDRFKAWLEENASRSYSRLTHLEKIYFSQLIDTIATVYTSHVTPNLTYNDIGMEYLIKRFDELTAPNKDKRATNSISPGNKTQFQKGNIIYGHFPQLVRHYTERRGNGETESIESNILKAINNGLDQYIAISGPAGAGKTQMACKIAHYLTSESNGEWALIAWLEASSPIQLRNQLVSLGDCLGLIDTENTDYDLSITKLFSTLPTIYNGRILLIYDNVDEIGSVSKYIPTSKQISLMVTTRSYEGWTNFSGWKLYEVGEFTQDIAIDLILRITGEENLPDATRIIEYSGTSPLMIGQMAATIRDDPSLTLVTYYNRLASAECKGIIKPIAGAWHNEPASDIFLRDISDLLSKMESSERTEALRQLSSLCYLAEGGTRRDWIQLNKNSISSRAYTKLHKSAIISETEDGYICKIHRFHANVIRNNWTSLGLTIYDACDLAAETLLKATSDIELVEHYHDIRATTQHVINQYISIFSQKHSKQFLNRPEIQQQLTTVLNVANLTSLQFEAFQLQDIVSYAIKHQARTEVASELHVQIANILRFFGQHTDALKHYSIALGSLKRLTKHKLVREISYRREKAQCLRMSQQPEKSIALASKCLTLAQRRLGKTNIQTIAIQCELGYSYLATGALENIITMLGPASDAMIDTSDHFELTTWLSARHILGTAYFQVGHKNNDPKLLTKGLEKLIDNISTCEQILPTEHLDALSYRETLAWAVGQIGEFERSLELYEDLLERIEEFYSPHHFHALNIRLNIGSTLNSLNQPEQAIQVLSPLELELEARMEPTSFTLANCRYSLGNSHYLLADYAAALELYTKVSDVASSLSSSFRAAVADNWFSLSLHLALNKHTEEAVCLDKLARSLR